MRQSRSMSALIPFRADEFGKATELSSTHVEKLLDSDAADREPREALERLGSTPFHGIWMGVVIGIALWAVVAGALLVWPL